MFHDVVGLTGDAHRAKFVRRYAELGVGGGRGGARFFADVQTGEFPSDEESYHMSEEVSRALLSDG